MWFLLLKKYGHLAYLNRFAHLRIIFRALHGTPALSNCLLRQLKRSSQVGILDTSFSHPRLIIPRKVFTSGILAAELLENFKKIYRHTGVWDNV